MDDGHEFRFRMSAYTPTTMPLGRLAEYLGELAKVLGEDHSVHLIELEEGSTVLVHKVDREAIPKIRERVASVSRGDAPKDAMDGYRMVNKLLREDNASAELLEADAEILEFPGKMVVLPNFVSIFEHGEVDGEIVRVGGIGDPVPIMLVTPDGIVNGCYAKRSIAKPLANRLFETVRIFGDGRWSRNQNGQWMLTHFRVDRFEELEDVTLSAVISQLRGIRGLEVGEDAIEELLKLRHGDEDEEIHGGI
jgi:hypothetical protein